MLTVAHSTTEGPLPTEDRTPSSDRLPKVERERGAPADLAAHARSYLEISDVAAEADYLPERPVQVVLAHTLGADPEAGPTSDPLFAILNELVLRCETLALVATSCTEWVPALDVCERELALLKSRAEAARELVRRFGGLHALCERIATEDLESIDAAAEE